MRRCYRVGSLIGCVVSAWLLAACAAPASPNQNSTSLPIISTATALPAASTAEPAVPTAAAPTTPATGPVSASGDASTPLQVTLELSKLPQLGEEVDATLTISTVTAMPQVTATLILPAGVMVTGGETNWQGDLAADQPITLRSRLRFSAEGNLVLSGHARHEFENGDIWADLATIYLTVLGPNQTPGGDTPTPPPAVPAS